jgi:uncharacterized protein YdeI (YjbR/CyaY-like superfamily)
MKTYRAREREAWRAWLAKNHDSEKVVWVVYPKKHTGEKCMSYEDSVEEALCYGWIDSIIKRIDDSTYARKFTPRTDHENWSDVNKERIEKCIREGRMTEIGLAKIKYANAEHPRRSSVPKVVAVPAFMEKALKANPTVWKNFEALAPSHRRNYTLWITDAKQEETKLRRLKQAIEMLKKSEKLGLK